MPKAPIPKKVDGGLHRHAKAVRTFTSMCAGGHDLAFARCDFASAFDTARSRPAGEFFLCLPYRGASRAVARDRSIGSGRRNLKLYGQLRKGARTSPQFGGRGCLGRLCPHVYRLHSLEREGRQRVSIQRPFPPNSLIYDKMCHNILPLSGCRGHTKANKIRQPGMVKQDRRGAYEPAAPKSAPCHGEAQ
jgi:hypothetical protein